jgi:hypothetical protein
MSKSNPFVTFLMIIIEEFSRFVSLLYFLLGDVDEHDEKEEKGEFLHGPNPMTRHEQPHP